MTIYCQVCLSLISPMKKLSSESRNILEILIGKQIKTYGKEPSVCFLCDHLLYKMRSLRDMCIKADCVWRSYAEMMEGPCARNTDLYLKQQHIRFQKEPFMKVSKTSNLCLYNYPNLNLKSSMQIIANFKGQIKCFNDLKNMVIPPNAASNQAVSKHSTLVSLENMVPNTAQPCSSGSATKDYVYELDIEYDQTEKPFGNTCEQDSNTDPLSNNRSSGYSLPKLKSDAKTSSDVTVKREPNADINCEDLNKSSIDSNIFLNIKKEPPDINEDFLHLQYNDSDPMIAENNIKSKEHRHEAINSQAGNEVVDQFRTINSKRVERNKKYVKLFECEICKKTFDSRSHLKSHMLSHDDSKPYECDICQKRFCRKLSFQRHMTIHSGSRPYDCEICKKSFANPHYLKYHLVIHSGSKQYKCKICKKRFSQKGSLKTHLSIIHSGSKQYECEICKKRFHDPRYMKTHLLIHSGNKPHECNICKRRFTQKCNLQRHVKTHSDGKT